MEIKETLLFKINDMNCEFRNLNKADISQDYVNGLMEQKSYIENIPTQVSLSSQMEYINGIYSSKSDTICGLFINEKMVGTAGAQLSTAFLQYIEIPTEFVATIGIFLFNKSYRGMGLGKTLVWAATLLNQNPFQAMWFGAGMEIENIPSLKSFLSCGFKKICEDETYNRVLLNYSELIKPDFIEDVEVRKIDQHAGQK